jgi:TRAP-type C4-dicarboxylate transport system permease small subunit
MDQAGRIVGALGRRDAETDEIHRETLKTVRKIPPGNLSYSSPFATPGEKQDRSPEVGKIRRIMGDRMKSLIKFIGFISYIGGVGAAASTFMLCLLIMASVVARYIFNRPFLYVDEIASYLLVSLVFLGLAYTLKEGGHIRVEMLVDRLTRKAQSVLGKVTTSIAVVWALAILIGVIGLWLRYLTGGVRGYGTLQAPLWVPTLPLVIGGAFLLLQVLAEIIKAFQSNKNRGGSGT